MTSFAGFVRLSYTRSGSVAAPSLNPQRVKQSGPLVRDDLVCDAIHREFRFHQNP